MRKKLFGLVLVLSMAVGAFAACKGDGGNTPDPTKAPVEDVTGEPTKAPDPTKAPEGETVPEAKYYFPFEDTTGLTVKVNDFTGETADTRVVDTEKTMFFTNGVKGQCAWFDGTYGAELDVEPLDSDTWTMSFWVNAQRYSTYGAVITMGSDFYSEGTGAKWLNITRSEFDGVTFPTFWSRNEAEDIWPWFNYATDTEAGKREWAHITLVSDENDWTEDGVFIDADLYINGEYVDKVCQLTPGIFGADETFHFLLGINYWDAIYKGALDELYIFDQALTAGQIATLYADGNTSEQPVNPAGEQEGRDHSDVTTTGTVIGATDCTTEAGTVYTDTKVIPVGGSAEFKFANYTKGETFEDTFALILQNVANAHNTTDNAAYKEHAVVNAALPNNTALESYLVRNTFNQFNPKTFGDNVDKAKYVVTVKNNGATVDVLMTADCADGVTRYLEYVGIPVEGEVYGCLTVAGGFIDYLPDIMLKGTALGNTDLTSGWWSAHSEPVKVEKGETVTTRLVNYTAGSAVYQNWVAVLQNVPAAHSADADPAYKEYAVVRSDNYGWGAGYDNNENRVNEFSWSWDLANADDVAAFIEFMKGAVVDVAVTNNGTTADVVATVTGKNGEVHTMKYLNIAIDGDLYYCFTVDGSCLDILGSYSGTALGELDCSTPWWTTHSDPVAVPVGETVSTHLINHTSGLQNYHNFVVVLQNTATGHGTAENPDYAEYAVMRADNYGWGAGYEVATLESDWDWTTFTTDMNNADVVVAVTNHGTTADVVCTVTTTEGKVYTQKYLGVAIAGDLYYCFTVEGGWLDILG